FDRLSAVSYVSIGSSALGTAAAVSPRVLRNSHQRVARGSAMRQFAKNVVKFLKAENGPTAVEYAVLLALIIVVCLGSLTALGNNSNQTYKTVKNALPGGS